MAAKAGSFNPASVGLGNHSISGLGFRPQIVLFIGTNKTTEDAVVQASNCSIFMGWMAEPDSGGIVSWSQALIADGGSGAGVAEPERGNNFHNSPIQTLTGPPPDPYHYQAGAVSFDADGFTIDINSAGAGLVHWLALGEINHVFTELRQSATDTIVTMGFPPLGFFLVGGNTGGLTAPIAFAGESWTDYGAGAWPADRTRDLRYASMNDAFGPEFGTPAAHDFESNGRFFGSSPPDYVDSEYIRSLREGFGSQILSEAHGVKPTGGDDGADFEVINTGGTSRFAMVWHDHVCGVGEFLPLQTVGATVDWGGGGGLTETDAAFYLCQGNNLPSGGGEETIPPIFGFGIATREYQGSCFIESNSSPTRLYQSRQYSWISRLPGTGSGRVVGTTDLDVAAPLVRITTQIGDDVPRRIYGVSIGTIDGETSPLSIRHALPTLGAGPG